jgi:ribosomal protein L25 (general stress protein Ctc)
MAEIILAATPRPPPGTRPARRLRGEGKIPGVVYGLGTDPITLTVEWRELRAALITEQAFYQLEAPVLRVGGYNVPYPPSRIEEEFLPDLDRVLDAVDRSLAH